MAVLQKRLSQVIEQLSLILVIMHRAAEGTSLQQETMPITSSATDFHSAKSSLLTLVCSLTSLLILWMVRNWWCGLRKELRELHATCKRLQDEIYEVRVEHDHLSQRSELQHAGLVRLGGFTPYRSLTVQQQAQIFDRERRNMMAYRSMGPDRFMSTVLHQDRRIGLRDDYTVNEPMPEPTGEQLSSRDDDDMDGQTSDTRIDHWTTARNMLQAELDLSLVSHDLVHAAQFQQCLLMLIDVTHQDRLLTQQDRERLFTALGDCLEGFSTGLRRRDSCRASRYLQLAAEFRNMVFAD